MNLGQRLKQARLEQGLSQRQLCGDTITRNMLSLIENGAAKPSMDTLKELAAKLGKPVSYFLDEAPISSANLQRMEQARSAFGKGAYAQAVTALETYAAPDAVFDWEAMLLLALAKLSMAEQALAAGKRPYAMALLEQAAEAGKQTPYYTPDLERRRLLVLGQLTPVQLPQNDRELLLRAKDALAQKQYQRAEAYLAAAEDQRALCWLYLKGQVFLAKGDLASAKCCLEAAWEYDPKSCARLLEECCRQQEDFKEAYRYACLLREWK